MRNVRQSGDCVVDTAALKLIQDGLLQLLLQAYQQVQLRAGVVTALGSDNNAFAHLGTLQS